MSKKLFEQVVLPLLAALTGDDSSPSSIKVEVYSTEFETTVEFTSEPAVWHSPVDSTMLIHVETGSVVVGFLYQVSKGRVLEINTLEHDPWDEPTGEE
jgi:hypothetical protein